MRHVSPDSVSFSAPAARLRGVMMSLRKPAIATAVVLAGLVAGWWWLFARAMPVSTVPATRGTAVEIVYGTGAVEPIRWAKVASVVRDRIVEICDCEGKAVTKGEVLVRLDDRELRAGLEELRAREQFIKREMDRATELIAKGAATTQAYERTSMDLRQIQALIAVQVEKIADYTIVAPMDGIVLRRDGEIGEIAEAGQILLRIGVPKPLQVVAEVNEEDIPRVAVGQSALFRTDAFVNRRLEGRVREITPMGDPVAKTYRVKISLPDDTPLKPGMSVEVNIVTRQKENALLVPADAVQGGSVFVLDGAAARKREVAVGIRGTRATEIESGLVEGERVIAPLPTGLADGQRVNAVARQ
jgi:RND family efflux transporter MFP subunit